MRLGLLRRQPAGADQLGDERVVVGQLVDLVVADQVGARVADVADRDDAVLEERDGDRRAHARGVRVLASTLVDLAVRLLDQRDDSCLAAAVDGLAEGVAATRSDLAASRAAHPVGDREQRRMADPGILVAPAPAARMERPVLRPDGLMSRTSGRSRPRERGRRRQACAPGSSRTPFTKVPFVDPTSSIHTPSRRGSTRAWFADA